jgi:uncharacterized protein
MRTRGTGLLAAFVAMLAAALCFSPAFAQVITLERPGERDFILDTADLITPEDEKTIKETCDRLLTDTRSPIIIVTIESMAKHTSRANMTIETFAKTLFDSWGIGHLMIDGQASNTGILLLVSRDDRKARIELGVGWTYEKEAVAQQIMQNVIVPRFRNGEYSTGIREGVEALEQMGRADAQGRLGDPSGGMSIPGMQGGGSGVGGGGGGPVGLPGPASMPFGCGCGALGLMLLLAIARMFGGGMGSMNRRGYGYGFPYGWGMGGPASGGSFPSGRSGGGFGGGGGGGFSGGSFGGGFSGGRGASGSW